MTMNNFDRTVGLGGSDANRIWHNQNLVQLWKVKTKRDMEEDLSNVLRVILLTKAAIVVDLPLPVAPVIKIKPLRLFDNLMTESGRPKDSNLGGSIGNLLYAAAILPL